MARTDIQQIHAALEPAKHILITCRHDAGGDAIGSAVALLLFLEKLGKRADIVIDGFTSPRQFSFLKKTKEIKSAVSHLQKFVVTIDVKNTGARELSYDIKEDKLRIFVTPERGMISRNDVRTAQSDFTYDVIMAIDTHDLDSLGNVYQENTDFFYAVPIINIDHHAANEFFGSINLVDSTAASTAEVVFDLLTKLGAEYVSEDVASALLTGMIAKTHSFKTDNIRPRTLSLAAKLMSLGANREHIVHHLYQTRSIRALKLWGQALRRLKTERGIGLVSTTLTREDFVRSGASEADLYDVVDELIGNSPEAKLTLLIHEHVSEARIHAVLTSHGTHDAKRLLQSYGAEGNQKRAVCFIQGKTLKEVEEEIIGHIKKQIK